MPKERKGRELYPVFLARSLPGPFLKERRSIGKYKVLIGLAARPYMKSALKQTLIVY